MDRHIRTVLSVLSQMFTQCRTSQILTLTILSLIFVVENVSGLNPLDAIRCGERVCNGAIEFCQEASASHCAHCEDVCFKNELAMIILCQGKCIRFLQIRDQNQRMESLMKTISKSKDTQLEKYEEMYNASKMALAGSLQQTATYERLILAGIGFLILAVMILIVLTVCRRNSGRVEGNNGTKTITPASSAADSLEMEKLIGAADNKDQTEDEPITVDINEKVKSMPPKAPSGTEDQPTVVTSVHRRDSN